MWSFTGGIGEYSDSVLFRDFTNEVFLPPSSQQIKLFATQLHQRSEYMELVQVKDVMNYMPQLRYIIKSQLQEPSLPHTQGQAPPNKRTRIS